MALYRIDTELKKRTELGLLVCGKAVADIDSFDMKDKTAGSEFGDAIDLVESLRVANESAGEPPLVSLDQLIKYRATSMNLPIEQKGIPSVATLDEFVQKVNQVETVAALSAHAQQYSKDEELLTQLLSTMCIV